jgi:hypothetical protein
MSQLDDQIPQPVVAAPVSAGVLDYGRPDTRVHFALLGALAIVAITDIFAGFILMIVGVFNVATPAGIRNIWMLILGVLVFSPGVMLWARTISSWRRSLVLLYADGTLLTLLALAAVLRLWHDIGGLQTDGTVFNLIGGGVWGTLNLSGAYVLCRSKRAFNAGHVDTIWCERIGLAIPIPLILLVTGMYILVNYYP